MADIQKSFQAEQEILNAVNNIDLSAVQRMSQQQQPIVQ